MFHGGREKRAGIARGKIAVGAVKALPQFLGVGPVTRAPSQPHRYHLSAGDPGVDLAGGLEGDLRDRIPAAGGERIGDADRPRALVLLDEVHLTGAGEDHAWHGGGLCSLDDVVEAEEVVGEEPGGEVVVVGRGGEMDEGVGTPEHGSDGRRVGEIGDNRLAGGGWTAIEGADMPAPREQLAAGGPAEPASGAGDDDGA